MLLSHCTYSQLKALTLGLAGALVLFQLVHFLFPFTTPPLIPDTLEQI